MHDMEEGVVKKKSSSGCLIIKKKGDGIGGFGASTSKKVFESTKQKKNKKKRPRSILNDSGSSDELLEPLRRKVVSGTKKFRNGSAVQKKGFVENSSISKSDRMESERKRSGLDVFEFDEYDGYDGKKMRKDYVDDRLKLSGIGSSRNAMVDKKKHSFLGGKSKGDRHEIEEDEAHLPISLLREKYRKASDEPIRLQGKNGVLKVMVNKQKKLGLSRKSYDHQEDEDRKGSRSEVAVKKNIVIRPSFYSDSKHVEKGVSFVKTQKSELKLRKSLSIKSSKTGESETDDSNVSLKLGSTSKQGRSFTKKVEKEGKTTPQTENITPIRGKEGQVKRGTGTEKQLLREKIRSMLLNVGWTIDYRPRRNRDYLDAVYISPTGTAYWSIIKAYDALQKQLEEDDNDIKPCGDSSPFTPLPEEILSKLTRQTQKKIERERKMKMKMKMKRRGDGGSKNANVKEFVVGTDSGQQEEKLSSYMKQNRQSRKRRLREADHASGDDSSEKPSIATNSDMIQGRKSRTVGRCTLFIRSSDKGLNSVTDGSVPYTGKRTLLAWLIDSGVVHMSEKVQYMNRRKTRAMLEGWITRDGIHCGCCSKILTISKFEIHAGSKQRHPYPNIFLESGLSLMQCQIEAWNRQEESKRQGFHTVDTDGDDPDDDTCGLCGDGGDLICCDGCPSTFHLSCLDIQMLPPGDWHCPNCICKFCGIGGGSIAEANGRTSSELLLCNLCEKKYHESCRQEIDDLPVDSSNATTFCGQTCRELFGHLQKLLGVKHELEGGFSWSLIHRMDPVSDMLHLGFSQRVECNSKLAVALSVMDECFLPIVDRRSGINLMHNVIYNCGSNFSRLNYSGFYTAILERGDEIIAAASIRIHGTQLAEMPFIGTRHIYRRRGMCRRLLCAIELVLCSLKVEKLIIPAIAEHMHTWTEVFNFNPLEELHKQEMRSINMLVFPGTDMLQKLLVKQEIPDENITANSDAKSIEVKENHPLLPVLAKKIELDSSGGHGLHTCDDGVVQHVNEINGKVDVIDSGLQASALPSNESAESSSSADPTCEPKLQFPNKEIISINSQSVNKLAESTSDLKFLSPSDACPVILDIGNPVMNPPVEDNIESSAEGVVGDAHEVSAKASCIGSVLGSLGETSARNLAEANENQNSVSVSTVNHTSDEKDSGLQAPALPSNESAVSSSSADPPCEPKLQFPNKEIISINSQSVNKIAESTSDLKCLSPSDASPVILEIGNPVMDPPVEDNIESSAEDVVGDAHELSAKASCIGSVLGSFGETSARNLAEANENQNSVSVFTVNHTDEKSAVKINFDLDHAVEMERKVGVASDVPSDAEVASVESNIQSLPEGSKQDVYEVNLKDASDSKVASVELKIQSFAVGDGNNHEVKVGSVESALVAQNSTDEMYENFNPVSASTICDTDEATIQFNSDLNNQNAPEIESKLPVASECGSEAEAAPVENNIQSSAVDDMDDTHEIDAHVTSVEPVPDSLQGISVNSTVEEISENQIFILANNTVEEITENQNLISDCSFHGSDEIPIGFNQDFHWQTSIKVVSDLTVASKVVSDEVVAPSDIKIQSIGESEAGDAHEVNVEEASVELVRDSIGATSSQNCTTPAINENLRSSCGSDENGVQIKSVSDHECAIEIESELHVATEIASSAMHRESDIIHTSGEN